MDKEDIYIPSSVFYHTADHFSLFGQTDKRSKRILLDGTNHRFTDFDLFAQNHIYSI